MPQDTFSHKIKLIVQKSKNLKPQSLGTFTMVRLQWLCILRNQNNFYRSMMNKIQKS